MDVKQQWVDVPPPPPVRPPANIYFVPKRTTKKCGVSHNATAVTNWGALIAAVNSVAVPPYREKASTTHWFMCPLPGHSALQASVKHGARRS